MPDDTREYDLGDTPRDYEVHHSDGAVVANKHCQYCCQPLATQHRRHWPYASVCGQCITVLDRRRHG